jgi:hypothetical protein
MCFVLDMKLSQTKTFYFKNKNCFKARTRSQILWPQNFWHASGCVILGPNCQCSMALGAILHWQTVLVAISDH